MASSGKKKTTMAKLNRESKMREKRQDKLARKEARKLAATLPPGAPDDGLTDYPADESPMTEPQESPVEV